VQKPPGAGHRIRPTTRRTSTAPRRGKLEEIVQGLTTGQRRPQDPCVPAAFTATERSAFVSFTTPTMAALRQSAATSIPTLVIHDDDVVVGTHGRSSGS